MAFHPTTYLGIQSQGAIIALDAAARNHYLFDIYFLQLQRWRTRAAKIEYLYDKYNYITNLAKKKLEH
jgi:hypothetical protein